MEQAEQLSQKYSSRYLWNTFLKVGSISFGGNMALLAMVQRIMIEKDKSLSRNVYFDAIGLASLLPGPMAVNAVTFIGYGFRGRRGAAVSLVAILLPAFLLMLLLSWAYFKYAARYNAADVMQYVTGTVVAIIFSTAVNMHQKEIGRDVLKNMICLAAFAILVVKSNYLVTALLFVAGIVFGMTRKGTGEQAKRDTLVESSALPASSFSKYLNVSLVILLTVIACLFFFDAQSAFENIYAKIAIVFSGVSLSLFGGGFVAVPVMQSLFVHDLRWLTSAEFVDAIAFSQITPGPILVSATFIGYKMGGWLGACLATIAMFAPSAILITLVSTGHQRVKNNLGVRRALDGMKVVIIGMIAASAIKILTYSEYNLKAIAMAVIVFVAIQAFKVNPIVTVLMSALLGFLIENVI